MARPRISRPSPAMVVACAALVVALGGTAIAAKKIGSKQIKKGGIKTKNLATAAVKKSKLDDGAVTSDKLASAAVVSDKLAQDVVATGKIQGNAVTQGKLANDSVGTAQLLADSVGTNKLKDAAVTAPKVANGLGLDKVAAVVVPANPDPPLIEADTCDDAPNVQDVPGLQAGDSILVLPTPTTAASQADLAPIAGQIDPATGDVNVVFCNGGANIDAGPQPVTIVAFR